MKKASLACVMGLFLNACSSVPTPTQYDVLLKGEARDKYMSQLIDDANSGDPELQYYLGTLYENARFTSKDRTKAIEWYRLAAEHGSEKGQASLLRLLMNSADYYDQRFYVELGDYYLQGRYVPQDYEKALNIYLHAASRGNKDVPQKLIALLNQLIAEKCTNSTISHCDTLRTEAQYQLAMLYRSGKYLKKNTTKSQALMQKAAAQGHDGAKIKTASDLIGVENQDWSKIRNLLESIKQHSAWSAASLASLSFNGQGGDVDQEKALHFYEISAELGNEESAAYVSYLHNQGEIPGTSPEKAGHYLWIAAQKDYKNTRALLAQSYLFGSKGIPADDSAAAEWGKLATGVTAAWLCHEAYFPNVPQACINRSLAKMVREEHPFALFLMGRIYAEGPDSHKNIERAISLYQSAMSYGEYAAKSALAELYLDGKAGAENQEKGLKLLHEMQRDSEPGAAFQLANYAFEQKDYSQALHFSLQAEKEDWVGKDTYYHLYRLYSGELDTPKDNEKAAHYFALALSELNKTALYDKAITILDNIHDTIITLASDGQTNGETANDRLAAAMNMLKKSASKGYIPAMLRLATYYNDQNQPRQAQIWTLEAAANGDIKSQKTIGAFFESKQTLTAAAYARHWYGQAEIQEDKDATQWMAKFGAGNIDVDDKGKYCNEATEYYCYSRSTSKNPVRYFRQKYRNEYKLQQYADGSVTFSDNLQPHEDWLPDLKANIEQVWPTHCGFALQKATGNGLLLFSRTKQFCQPPHDVVMAVYKHGIKDVAASSSATSLLLNNGEVVGFGGAYNGGGLIIPAAHSYHEFQSLNDEVKIKRALASDVTKIVSATTSMAALKSDGSVYIWGDQGIHLSLQLPGTYKDIMANGSIDAYCTRDNNDKISCWSERSYDHPQLYPDNIKQFALIENDEMALSFDAQGKLTAWPMYNLGSQYYTPYPLPSSLANFNWTQISKEQVTDGFVTVLTRSDGERFAVRFNSNQFAVRPFHPKQPKMMRAM
ncbi:sel1 repeat family protein [Photobacterium galatheae]|uniref:tetratricopeptide repeat protein n=1 Tax=Photobacterium galatheae TaxID=1654360 RepID=UPI00202CFF06|nr:sel1 repeat family protein [Photobacterium galatheae]